MRALVETHALIRQVSLRDLFRACYMHTFGKDISSQSLDQDLASFKSAGVTPPYVIKYFLNKIGAKT